MLTILSEPQYLSSHAISNMVQQYISAQVNPKEFAQETCPWTSQAVISNCKPQMNIFDYAFY